MVHQKMKDRIPKSKFVSILLVEPCTTNQIFYDGWHTLNSCIYASKWFNESANWIIRVHLDFNAFMLITLCMCSASFWGGCTPKEMMIQGSALSRRQRHFNKRGRAWFSVYLLGQDCTVRTRIRVDAVRNGLRNKNGCREGTIMIIWVRSQSFNQMFSLALVCVNWSFNIIQDDEGPDRC